MRAATPAHESSIDISKSRPGRRRVPAWFRIEFPYSPSAGALAHQDDRGRGWPSQSFSKKPAPSIRPFTPGRLAGRFEHPTVRQTVAYT